MHVLPLLPLAAGLVAALPAGQAAGSSLERRQLSRNDVAQGGTCPKVILVYARATGEMGNLGILGGVIGSALESEYGQGNVWVQGVGGAYTAGVTDNILPDGTSQAAIAEMVGLFGQAAQKCPQATIVTGGYSQGSALTAAAVRDVSDDVRSKIAGAVLFGYTKNAQNNGGIPNYPSQDVKVFCNPGDLVCSGSLIVAAPHFAYQSAASGPAPQFLIGRINAAGAGGGAGGDAGGDAGAGTDSGAGAGTGTGSDAGAGTGTGSDAGAGTGTGTDAGAGTGTGTGSDTGSGSGAGGLGGIGNLFGGGTGGLGGIGNLIGGDSAGSTSGSRCWWCFFGNS